MLFFFSICYLGEGGKSEDELSRTKQIKVGVSKGNLLESILSLVHTGCFPTIKDFRFATFADDNQLPQQVIASKK